MPHSPGIGAIFGIVSENGIAKAGGRVGLYDRSSMLLVNKTVADSLGGYAFTGLNQNTNDYLVMALDDDGSPAKNALVQDYVQPIPGHMGATAPSNWQQRVRRKDPILIWVPRIQGTHFAAMGATAFPQSRMFITGSYVPAQPTITPGAPQFPSFRLNPGALNIPVFMNGANSLLSLTGSEWAAIEFVAETAADFQVTLLGFSTTSGNTFYLPMVALSYTASSKQFRFASGKGINVYSSAPFDLTAAANWFSSTNNQTGLPVGVHHFVVVTALSGAITFYIDGQLIATFSIAGTNGQFYTGGVNFGTDNILCVGGIGLSGASLPNSGSGLYGPMAAYRALSPIAPLSAADVTALYNDLMVGTTPAASGYVRDVLIDDPAILYRLNEPVLGTATEFLTGLPSATHYGAITFAAPSPIVGGLMTRFGGGAMRAARGSGSGSPVQRSWEFWASFDVSPPPAARTLFAGHMYADTVSGMSGQYWWRVQHMPTSGVLQLQILVGTGPTTETITFLYAPPANVTKHIVIVVDKIALKAYLYVNGDLQEQVTVTGTFFSEGLTGFTQNTMWVDSVLTIGGWVPSTVTPMTDVFLGSLSEIALYYKALTPDRVKSHYDARLLI